MKLVYGCNKIEVQMGVESPVGDSTENVQIQCDFRHKMGLRQT